MPEVTRYGRRRKPSALVCGRKPTAGEWWELQIIHELNRRIGKHHIITGIYASPKRILPTPGDAHFLGEMLDVERREKLEETRWRRGVFDAEVRGAPRKNRSVAARSQAMDDAASFVDQFYGDLPQVTHDLDWLVANHLAGMNVLQPLARSQSTKRLYLLGRLPETLDLRWRQEGRRNPGSTRAVLAAIRDRLTAQIAFDAMSAQSLDRRSRISLAGLSYDILQLLIIIDLVGHFPQDVVYRRLPPILQSLCAKPALFPATYIDWLLYVRRAPLDGGQTRALIVAACEAELQLLSINAALSKLRDNRELINAPMLATLRASVEAIAIDRHTEAPAYGNLSRSLQVGLDLLPDAMAVPREKGISSPGVMIRGMKYNLRNRLFLPDRPDDPLDHPWMLRPTRDGDGRPMWSAQRRFGARPRR